jgi:threonine dehydratase
MQVPPEDYPAFEVFLDKIGYVYCDESHNPAYHLFVNGDAKP